MFHMELGLARIAAALSELKLDKPSFPVIQVLGTNGKGSCASFLSSLASAHNMSCGLFLSPHFVSIEERIKINGSPVSRKLWLEGANLLYDSLKGKQKLTYFEFLTALALLIFSRLKVDIAIFEAGLGGRNDATSIIPAKIHCLTPIAMDHAAIIGPRLQDIASDKAAAIQPHSLVFAAPQSAPVRKILSDLCESRQAGLKFIKADPLLPKTGLQGETQKTNASLALYAWRALAAQIGLNSSEEKEKEALQKAFIPGRFQKITGCENYPALILDGAHNPHAIQALLKNLTQVKPYAIIFSALADKDWSASLELINHSLGSIPMFIPLLNNSRAASPLEIAAKRNRPYPDSSFPFMGKDALHDALLAATRLPNAEAKPLLLTGSLYLLADFFRLYPQYLESTQIF